MATPSLDARIGVIRRFNRFYTRQIGVLQDRLLDSDLSLPEGRVLYELAHRDTISATELCTLLALDAGYLSRLLRALQKRGLVQRRTSELDRRRSELTLTRKGRGAFAKLDASATREIASFLAPLASTSQDQLVSAMRAIERVLDEPDPASRAVELHSPVPGDMGWVIQRHGELYAAEYGWDERFEALVARIVAQYMEQHDPARERCWIARASGERVGSIFLVRHTDDVARLRLLLVEPGARGLGIGTRLVDECIRFAREAGYTRITLWTNAVLHAARAIYLSRGFRLVREEAHARFGSEQLGQDWELDL